MTFTNEENIDQPMTNQFSEIAERYISWTFNWKAYIDRTTQELQILTVDFLIFIFAFVPIFLFLFHNDIVMFFVVVVFFCFVFVRPLVKV